MIPYSRQDISEADINEVRKVLESNFLTQGPMVEKFEKSVTNYCGSLYGVAANSATSSLHIACLALDLGPGDWLWTSPNTYVSSANCGRYCGSKVDFVDIDPKTYNMSVKELEKKLIKAKSENKSPKVIIPVHFAGQSCDMKKIYNLSKEYNFKIIEDASHAIGGKYLDKSIGSCQYSDITVFSFHPVKIITTAEGGLATTNDKKLFERMQLLRNHGVTRDRKLMTKKIFDEWYYQQVDLGFNYRMNDLQAALGISQMKRLDEFVKKRNVLKKRYDELISDLPIIRPYQLKDVYSALHLYPIQIDTKNSPINRSYLFSELRKNGIGANVHYIPVHTQPYYKNLGFSNGDFPISESYYSNVVTLPIFSQMTFDDQDYIVKILRKLFNRF